MAQAPTNPPPSMTDSKPYLVRAIIDWLVDNGCKPYIQVATTHPLAELPRHYRLDPTIVLNIDAAAVSHYQADNEAIRFLARFNGVERAIVAPIAAIQAVYDAATGQGMTFPAYTPPATPTEAEAPAPVPEPTPKPRAPFLSVVKN